MDMTDKITNGAIIDFHSHILPGIDDGSKSVDMSAQMLAAMARDGVDVVIATPHFYGDRISLKKFLEKRDAAANQLEQAYCNGMPKILLGAEVAYFPGISTADGIESLCIEGTDLMLLEMPFASWSKREIREIRNLLDRGIKPVIAHLERFYSYQKDRGNIEALLGLPVYVQLNAESFLSFGQRRRAVSLLKENGVCFLGSDCHNLTSRKPNLAQGRGVIEKKLGKDFLCRMDAFSTETLKLEK